MKTHIALALVVPCVVIGHVGQSHAGPITWYRGDIDGTFGRADLAVSTGGTLVEAASFGDASAVPVTVNTVPFEAVDFSSGGSLAHLTGLTYDAGEAGRATATGGAIDTLTDTIAFQSGTNPQVGTLTGLTVGQLYEVQFFLSHPNVGRTLAITSGNTAVLRTRDPAQYVSGFFTADASEQPITFDANDGSQFLNGYQLRVGGTMPEPLPPPGPMGFGIDFSQYTEAPLQPGWESLAHDGTTVANETFSTPLGDGGEIVVSAQAPFWRDYRSIEDGLYVNYTDLLSDLILTNSPDQEMTLTLEGLRDGRYAITTYHHITQNSGTSDFDILLTDATGTDVLVHTGLRTTGISVNPRDPSDILTVLTKFQVLGGNPVTLRFDPTTRLCLKTGLPWIGGVREDTRVPTRPRRARSWHGYC